MNCAQVRENISLYIDDEVDENLKQEIEEHLQNCASCVKEYDELSDVTLLLRGIPDAALPERFDGNLREAIKKEKSIARAKKNRAKGWGSLAAVLVIGIFSFTAYNQMGGGAPMTNSMDQFAAGGAASSPPVVSEENISDESMDKNAKDEEPVSQTVLSIPEPPPTVTENGAAALDTASGDAAPKEVSRHLPEAGLESAENMEEYGSRDRLAAAYFFKLMAEKLSGFNYEVIDFWKDSDGIWNFEVKLYTVDEHGEAYTEKYIYAGQDGELWIKESSLSTDTAY